MNLKNKTSETIIEVLKLLFSRFRIPEEIIADNNPYGSKDFKDFANKWQFKITLSSPNYPKSNGLVERPVGIAKDIIRKAKSESKELCLLVSKLSYCIIED